MSCASFYERKLLNFKNCNDHRLARRFVDDYFPDIPGLQNRRL